MKTEPDTRLTLYGYWRSSAAYRVRIALNLKGLSWQSIPVHLVEQGGQQHKKSYRSINPAGLVPVLLDKDQVISQSLAICEYLDECFEQYPLLPLDALARARVRSLTLQIACDIHPLNNLRVLKYLKDQCGEKFDSIEWMKHWMSLGFGAIEQQLIDNRAGHRSHISERPGLFECFLIPQVYNAERFGTDMTEFPTINEIVTRCRKLAVFADASPENQPDAIPV